MFTSIAMFVALQTTHDPKYKTAFETSNRAVYEGSEVKAFVEKSKQKIKDKSLTTFLIAPAAYNFYLKKELVIQTHGVRIKYRKNTSEVQYSWGF